MKLICKSASKASGFNPLNGRKLILPGQYTKPSKIAGNFDVSKVSVEASNGIYVTFKPNKFSLVLDATKILFPF